MTLVLWIPLLNTKNMKNIYSLIMILMLSCTLVNAQSVSITPNLAQQGQSLTTVITGQSVSFQSFDPNGPPSGSEKVVRGKKINLIAFLFVGSW